MAMKIDTANESIKDFHFSFVLIDSAYLSY